MKMFVAGDWVDTPESFEVLNPFDGSLIDRVPKARPEDVERALASATEGARIMRSMPGYERYRILNRAAQIMSERHEELARIVSVEEGKTLKEGHTEAGRAIETMELSSEEAKRLTGEVLSLDGATNGRGKFGFTLRVPCGIVVAITPFNFPLILPCEKVGPALAAGNAVILKPASDTPLSALKLVEILLEAGLPPLAINCLTGSGAAVGDALCSDARVRKISFTGSRDIGEHICKRAGLKRVTMELGSNSPLIIMDDADLTKAAEAIVATGFGNAGQVCISAQRVIVLKSVYSELIEALQLQMEGIRYGNQLETGTTMGPMIREGEAIRVAEWVQEALNSGARLIHGGGRRGAVHEPTVLADVASTTRISYDELFGPAVALSTASDVDNAIEQANDTRYGLSAAIFTESLDRAMRFAQHVESGNIHINWGPAWRADLMPYGGLKESGMGKESPKYAIHEMTELKTVVVHGLSW